MQNEQFVKNKMRENITILHKIQKRKKGGIS